MKILNLYFIIAIALFLFIFNSNCQANEIENKFIKAGLIEVHIIDNSLKVDLVNSDPDKNYFRENFYNGLNNGGISMECQRTKPEKNTK